MSWISTSGFKLPLKQWPPSFNFTRSPLYLHNTFCSSAEPLMEGDAVVVKVEPVGGELEVVSVVEEIPGRELRGHEPRKEKLDEVIIRMMSTRPWTTHLKSAIRALAKNNFDDELVVNVLNGATKADHVLNFFRWLPKTGYVHNVETCGKAIEVLGRWKKLNHSREILLGMPKKGLEWNEDLFVFMIDSYGRAGIVQESVRLFEKMKELGVERSIKSYDVLFKVILRRGRYMMAKRYFNGMVKDNVVPTLHTYNTMIWGFIISMRVEIAARFWEEMKGKGISPNLITYNTMINGYFRVNKVEEAERFFVELKGSDLVPDVVTYTTMIRGYVDAGRVDDGMRLFDEMSLSGVKPNEITYATLLPGLCAKKLEDANRLLGEMVKNEIVPTDYSVFLKLISKNCHSGKMDWAADVIDGMVKLKVPVETAHYSVVIKSFCQSEEYEKAIKLLDDLIEKELVLNTQGASEIKPNAYNPMIQHLCANGQTKKAETFLRQLMKRGVQDPVSFNNLLRGQAKEGLLDSSFEILKIMSRRGVTVDADVYKLLIESFLEKGEPADAKTTLDSMIESGYTPDSALFRTVINSLFDDGRVQTASRVMVHMLEKGVKDNMDLAAKILDALLMRGHVEEALGRIVLLMNNGYTPDFDSIVANLCEKEKTIAAFKLVDFGLENDWNISSSSYDKVLNGLHGAGKTINAYSILCKLLIKGNIKNLNSREDLIKSLIAEGNTKQADTLSRMLSGGKKPSASKKGKKVAA